MAPKASELTAKSVRSRPNRPNRASESSDLSIGRSDDRAPARTHRPYGDVDIPADSLIGRMAKAAEADRAAFTYSIATFVDEQGRITHVNISRDPMAAMDRVEKRLGLVGDNRRASDG